MIAEKGNMSGQCVRRLCIQIEADKQTQPQVIANVSLEPYSRTHITNSADSVDPVDKDYKDDVVTNSQGLGEDLVVSAYTKEPSILAYNIGAHSTSQQTRVFVLVAQSEADSTKLMDFGNYLKGRAKAGVIKIREQSKSSSSLSGDNKAGWVALYALPAGAADGVAGSDRNSLRCIRILSTKAVPTPNSCALSTQAPAKPSSVQESTTAQSQQAKDPPSNPGTASTSKSAASSSSSSGASGLPAGSFLSNLLSKVGLCMPNVDHSVNLAILQVEQTNKVRAAAAAAPPPIVPRSAVVDRMTVS
jgi:hypothetical protein